MSWLSILRQKSPEIRQKAALVIAGVITLAVIGVWFGTRWTDWAGAAREGPGIFSSISSSLYTAYDTVIDGFSEVSDESRLPEQPGTASTSSTGAGQVGATTTTSSTRSDAPPSTSSPVE
ncbi:MAG: hypothetical protein WDZ79_02470 [Candidatus Paceibacterota bacterium]